jgi:polyisoprenoid-binding protein YceI
MPHRRSGLAAVIPMALLLSLGVQVAQPTVAQEATPVPVGTPGVIGETPAGISCEEEAIPASAVTYVIENGSSAVRYLAEEELASVGAVTAIGETEAFIGQILIGEDGVPLPCSRFYADLRTLKSDNSRRDNYLYRNTLETETYPLATFVLTGTDGLDGPLPIDEEVSFSLIGDFTVHGVTRPMRWDVTATFTGDQIAGTAVTQFNMPEFDIVPPKVGPVVALDETVRLEADIVAARPAE